MSRRLVCLLLVSLCGCGPVTERTPATWITNVSIVDGTGADAFVGSVRLVGELIETVSAGEPPVAADLEDGDQVVDGRGLFLAPGFIDTHSHHDRSLLDQRHAFAAISQGITTIVVGQDGSSPLPLAEFLRAVEQAPATVNVGAYSGHNTLRTRVLGLDFRREASDSEVRAMAELLRRDLDAGALGLSTGLEYDPGIYASTEEIVALAQVAGNAGGRYISHMRSEDRALEEAIEELLEVGRRTGIPVQISHFKLAMKSLWGQAPRILARLDQARTQGIDVTADFYPYEYWQSTMTVLFPDRIFNLASARFALEQLAPPEGIRLTVFAPAPELVGRTLAEIAEARGQDPAVTYLDLISQSQVWQEDGEGPAEMIIGTSMHRRDMEAILRWPHTNVCTDGGLQDRHPRGIGTYPRILGLWVRERQVLSLENAVHKSTKLAASHVGLVGRGVIEPGAAADLVLFDAHEIIDHATPASPGAPSSGIESVWVNGTLVFSDGEVTPHRPGHVLRRPGDRR